MTTQQPRSMNNAYASVASVSALFQSNALRIALVILTIALALINILQINFTSTKGYDIRKLEQQLTQLTKEDSRLSLATTELESIDRLISQVQTSDFVDGSIDGYVDLAPTTFASR